MFSEQSLNLSKTNKKMNIPSLFYASTGIPQFILLMWGHKEKTAEAKTAEIEVT